ncbi:MAG: 2-C-methyl-D-erythritol 4-phosphate cytidylyltransferase [Nitrospinae bacterium]|nr:2-C-methyl-D-erythritol 4-phosphate cytidylyltransferase [Nitrospinota bacterium]
MPFENRKVAAIVPAGGAGTRMGMGGLKQFLSLNGKPIVYYPLAVLESSPLVDEIILVAPVENLEFCRREIVENLGFQKVSNIVAGGAARQDSVRLGFNALSVDTGLVLIHDGVRPFITIEMVAQTLAAAHEHGAATVAIKVKDTLKQARNGIITGSVDREDVVRIQTPQAFDYNVLKQAFEAAARDGFTGSDESSLTERAGIKTCIVEGAETNIKITTPDDLRVAAALLPILAQ